MKIKNIPHDVVKFSQINLDLYLEIDITKLKDADSIRIKFNALRTLQSRQGLKELGEISK